MIRSGLIQDAQIINLKADNPTWIVFGYPVSKGSWGAFVILDKETNSVEVYDTNKWMHNCISFNRKTGELHYIVVRYAQGSYNLQYSIVYVTSFK